MQDLRPDLSIAWPKLNHLIFNLNRCTTEVVQRIGILIGTRILK